jgi:restriction endonuclease Mrr
MDKPPHERSRVFLSYAASDRAVVEQIATALQKVGVGVWFDIWELTAAGNTFWKRIDQALQASDLFLVFLSKASVASRWVQNELSAAVANEMKDRAITIIPVVIEDCDIPPVLTDRMYVDLRGDVAAGVQTLVDQLAVAPTINLAQLDPPMFERLVGELLIALGFEVTKDQRNERGQRVNFLASRTSRDPFGAERTETWVVEVKAYREKRISPATIRQLLGYLASTSFDTKGLLVTNSRLTSVAREFLSDSTLKAGRDVRVIDSTELTSLLLHQPDLVSRYFSPPDRP